MEIHQTSLVIYVSFLTNLVIGTKTAAQNLAHNTWKFSVTSSSLNTLSLLDPTAAEHINNIGKYFGNRNSQALREAVTKYIKDVAKKMNKYKSP